MVVRDVHRLLSTIEESVGRRQILNAITFNGIIHLLDECQSKVDNSLYSAYQSMLSINPAKFDR